MSNPTQEIPVFDPKKPYKPVQEAIVFDPDKPYTPVEKKNLGVNGSSLSGKQSSPSQSQLGGDEQIPQVPIPTDKIDNSFLGNMILADNDNPALAAKNIQKLKDEKIENSGNAELGGDYLQDNPENIKAANSLSEQLKSKGYDATDLYNKVRDVPDEILKLPEFNPENAKTNPENYDRKLATAAWQTNLEDALLKENKDGELSDDVLHNINTQLGLAQQGGHTYNAARNDTKLITDLINTHIKDDDLKKRLLDNVATDRMFTYGQEGAVDKEDALKNDPRSQYLDKDEMLGLHYLEDTDPDKAKGFDAVLLDPKKLENDLPAQAGYQEKMMRLKQIGVGIQQSANQEELNNLNNKFNQQGDLAPEEKERGAQLTLKNEELHNQMGDAHIKYGLPDVYDRSKAVQEILGQENVGADWLANRTGQAVANTVEGVKNLAISPFLSDESSKINQLEAAGGNMNQELEGYVTQKNSALQDFKLKLSPSLQSKIDAVKSEFDNNMKYGHPQLSDVEVAQLQEGYKKKQADDVYNLLRDNPNDWSREQIKGGKVNISPSSLFYSVGGLGAQLVPFMAAEVATGGGATATMGRKLLSTFTAAAATSFQDEYAQAVRNNEANPFGHALRVTAINSAALAGAGTPDAIRAMLGSKTAVGELVSKMTNDEIEAALKEKPQALKQFGKAFLQSAKEGLQGGGKITAFQTAGQLANNAISGETPDGEKMMKNALIQTLTFGTLGTIGGIGAKYDKINNLQSDALYKASLQPEQFTAAAQEQLKNGAITPDQFNQIKTNIEKAAEVSKKVPFVGDNGKPLSNENRSKILLLKMQEYDIKEQSKGDISDKLKEKATEKLDELKTEMNEVYKNKKEADTHLSEPIRGLDAQGIPIGDNVPVATDISSPKIQNDGEKTNDAQAQEIGKASNNDSGTASTGAVSSEDDKTTTSGESGGENITKTPYKNDNPNATVEDDPFIGTTTETGKSGGIEYRSSFDVSRRPGNSGEKLPFGKGYIFWDVSREGKGGNFRELLKKKIDEHGVVYTLSGASDDVINASKKLIQTNPEYTSVEVKSDHGDYFAIGKKSTVNEIKNEENKATEIPNTQEEGSTTETKPIENIQQPKEESEVDENGLPFGKSETTGIAHEKQMERSFDTKTLAPERGEGVSVEEAVKHGQDLLANGGDAEKAAADFKKDPDKNISYNGLSLVRAKHAELVKATNKAIDEFGENSKQAKEATKTENDWYKEVVKPMQTEWSKQGMAQQGDVDIDTGSFVGVRRAIVQQTGKEPTPQQSKQIKELTDKNKALTKKVEELHKKFVDNLDENAGAKSAKGKKKTSEDYAKERTASFEAAREALKKIRTGQSGLGVGVPFARELAAIAPHVAKIVKSLIEEGVSKLSDIVDRIHDEFKDDIKGIRSRDILDVIAGDYDNKDETKTPEVNKLSDFKRQAKLTKKLQDLQSGLPEDYETRKTEPTSEVKELLEKIKKVKKDLKDAGYMEEKKSEPTDEEKNIKHLEKQLEKLRENKPTTDKPDKTYSDKETELMNKIKEQKDTNKFNDLVTRFADKEDEKFTPQDTKDIWEYAKREYIDKGASVQDMLKGVSTDLGLSYKQVLKAFEQTKGTKVISDEMFRTQYKRNNAINNTKLFIEKSKNPKVISFLKAIPNAFFKVKTFGHGTVGFITHAGMNIFRPSTWHIYWPLFFKQFKNAFGDTADYEKEMESLRNDRDFTFWQRAGLAVDPKKTYDNNYEGAARFFGKVGATGDRGFNTLKVLRFELAKYFYNKLSNSEKGDPNSAVEISKLVNHSTGTSEIKIPKWANTWFFAPKLEASRWQSLISDPAKAINTFTKWSSATPSEKAAAKYVAKNAGEKIATYVALLGANSAILSLTGSNQKVNYTNPLNSDWLKFKGAGKTLDVTGGMEATMRFVGGLINEGRLAYTGDKKDLREKPMDKDSKSIMTQARYKLSPFGGTIVDLLTGADAMGTPLPFSNIKPKKGEEGHSILSYLGEQQLPIPIAEGIKETVNSMKENGMSDVQILDVLKGIAIGVITGGSGAKISDEPNSKEDKENKKDKIVDHRRVF